MLIEPVALSDFFLSFFTSAMIILWATVYAALFAWGKVTGRKAGYWGASLAYAALLMSVAVFSTVNHFSGYWLVLSALMLLGYAVMPHFIWHLCVASHDEDA